METRHCFRRATLLIGCSWAGLACSSAGTTGQPVPPGEEEGSCVRLETMGLNTRIAGAPEPEPACPAEFDPEPVLAAAMETPTGWAAVDAEGLATTTGGLGGEVVLATTLAELVMHASSSDPLIIAVCGSIGTGVEEIKIGSNKTLIGVGTRPTVRGGLDIEDAQNVVVRNLFIRGLEPMNDQAYADGIGMRRTHHAWLDHLDIADGRDGNLDVTDTSNYVTISYSRFWYSNPERAHRFSNLVGSSDNAPDDVGRLKVTFHHNWWADNVVERMPRTRYGDIHVYNNLYTSQNDNYCIRTGVQARLLVERNYFWAVQDPIDVEGGNLLDRENFFDNASGAKGGTGMAFEAPYPYELDEVCDIPLMVTTNAGPQ